MCILKTQQFPKESGIYAIVNTVNNKLYIGSSKNLQKRLRKHLNTLRINKHFSQHLQNAWNFYGETNFEIKILALVPQNKLLATEQKFFDEYQPFHNENGYNSSVLAHHCVHTDESKQKLREANLGKKYTQEVNQKKASLGETNGFYGKRHSKETKLKIAGTKPFICIETGEVFDFYGEAAKKLNARIASISDCISGKKYVSNKLHFILLEKVGIQPQQGIVILTDEERTALINQVDKRRKVFKCITTGEIFTSVNTAALKLGITRQGVSRCLKGESSQTGGYKFEYC